MGLVKTALIGAAVYGAIKYITKKDDITGRSIVDDLKDKAPEWIDKAKGYKQEMEAKYNNFASEFPEQ
ncbi:MAG: YtxH domain-containing protein [Bacteroidota bacterium]